MKPLLNMGVILWQYWRNPKVEGDKQGLFLDFFFQNNIWKPGLYAAAQWPRWIALKQIYLFFIHPVSSLSLLLCYPCDDSLLTPDVNAKKHRFTKQETDQIAVKLHKKCVINAENTVVVQPKGQGLVNALSDVEEEWPWCLELKETETNNFFLSAQ